MASLALLLVTLWLMSKGKNYQWTLWPFLFMFVTTIAALLYKAYESFIVNLGKAAALAEAQKLTVGQIYTANIIIGLISLVLVFAAISLAWDAYKAFQRYRETAPAKA
jgi:carbon starvation protein CstA